MTLPEHIDNLKRIKQQILDELPKLADQIAVSTLTLVKQDAIEEGIIIEGKPGTQKQYSTTEVYTSSFKKKTLNSAGQAYIADNKKGTWGGLRGAQGLKSDRVNLGYSMRMWTGIQVLRTNETGYGQYETIVGAADDETKAKIEGHVERYGMFFDPTEEQKQLADEVIKDRLSQIMNS